MRSMAIWLAGAAIVWGQGTPEENLRRLEQEVRAVEQGLAPRGTSLPGLQDELLRTQRAIEASQLQNRDNLRRIEETMRVQELQQDWQRRAADMERMAAAWMAQGALLAQPAPAPAPALAPLAPMPPPARTGWKVPEEERAYRSAKSALEERDWDRAAQEFDQVAQRKGLRADAALYWKAYTQAKLGRRGEALATLDEMMRTYASSRWLDDAKVLQLEVRQSSGQAVSPDSEANEDLKVLAVNGILHSDPERALPVLEGLIRKSSSPRLKERALFVLAQSKAPQARELMAKFARGGVNPDLQYRAVEYIGYQSTPEVRQLLQEIYTGSTDTNLKRAVLRGYSTARDKERLLAAAKSEQAMELRREAVRGLGSMNAEAELWQLFADGPAEMKLEILRALDSSKENFDRYIDALHAEKDPRVRRELVEQIGGIRSLKSAETLAGLYAGETDINVRRAIADGLYNQRQAKVLVDLARAESDPKMKRVLVERLSRMKDKEASDYMLELLNK